MSLGDRRVRIVLLFLLGLLLVAFGVLFLRLRGSIVVRTKQEGVYPGGAVFFRQDDEAWADETLGDSSFTMESSGCLVACIASAVSMETGQKITPGELNRLFSEQNVYDGEGNIQWAAIDRIDGYSAEVFDGVSAAGIDSCLEEGHYPIVRVRVNGIGNYHYVLVVGIDGQDYVCMDPLQSKFTKLSRYLSRVYAVRVVSAL